MATKAIDDKCPKCKNKLVIASADVDYWEILEAPFGDGIERSVKDKDGNIIYEVDGYMRLYLRACIVCNFAEWLRIDECSFEIADIDNRISERE